MAKKKQKPTWGGAREGAGRPEEEASFDVRVALRLPSTLHENIERARGDKPLSQWVRETLQKETEMVTMEKAPETDGQSTEIYLGEGGGYYWRAEHDRTTLSWSWYACSAAVNYSLWKVPSSLWVRSEPPARYRI